MEPLHAEFLNSDSQVDWNDAGMKDQVVSNNQGKEELVKVWFSAVPLEDEAEVSDQSCNVDDGVDITGDEWEQSNVMDVSQPWSDLPNDKNT